MRVPGIEFAGSRRWALSTGGLLGLSCLAGTVRGADAGLAVRLAMSLAGMNNPRLSAIPIGTLIKDKPPKGWSHLVLKSIPRLASGDRDSLPESANKTATLFRMVIVANVRPTNLDEQEFRLERVGIGLCVPRDEDQDIVVSADRLDALGVHLSTVERLVLDSAEAELAEGRIIARTATFALFRTPTTLVVAGKHRRVSLYYAFCVDRKKGTLDVGVWAMRPENEPQLPPSAMVKLSEEVVFDCGLDVQAKRILGAVPYSWSFAMQNLPPGRSFRIPGPLGEKIAATAKHPDRENHAELEQALLEIMREPAARGAADASEPVNRAVYRQTTPPPGYRDDH